MKKALARVMLLALIIVIIAGVMPLSANASSNSNKTTIFQYLTEELGFNSAAACGIMANIEKESNFRPNVVIRDSNGLPSGGLCMWNGGRFNSLKNFCNNNGLNYLSIEGQLSYLEKELKNSYYKHIYNYLKNVANTSEGAYNAAHYWCYYFEIPANRSTRAVQRGNTAISSYWPVYGGVELDTPSLKAAKGTTYEPGKKLTVKWTSSGEDTDGYRVYLVSKNAKTGKYDYNNPKVAHLDSDERSFTIKGHNMKTGTYKVYVYAFNKVTGIEEKSNVLTLKIKCSEHDYSSKITTVPTEEKDGVRTYTCKVCGKVKEKSLTYSDYITSSKVKDLKTTGNTDSRIRINWDKFKNADGYRIYMKDADGWKNIGTASAKDGETFVATGLNSDTKYSFKVKAYVEVDGKKLYTESSNIANGRTEKAENPVETPTEAPAEQPTEAPAEQPTEAPATNTEEETNPSSDFTNIFKDFCDGFLKF